MAETPTDNPFAAVRKARTEAPNFDLDTDAIIERLTQWQALCSFTVTGAEGDTVTIEFMTFPKDMEAFIHDLYDFCPDLVDQGTACVQDVIESLEESGQEVPAEMQKLIEGVDFDDENFGLEILKREILLRKNVNLWWD